jgi:flagellar motor switch protein FliG
MDIQIENLSGMQKSAILVVALGLDSASEIFKNMRDRDIERLSVEIANMRDVPSVVMEAVVEEFHQMIMAQEYISQGGIDYARRLLDKAMGPRKASEIVARVENAIHVSGFKLLKDVDPNQLLNFVQHEHPQTIALILANLEADQTASIIAALPQDVQGEVAFRMATMNKISPELLTDIESVLESQVETVFGQDLSVSGGAKSVANILNMAGRSAEKNILLDMEKRNPELAAEIKNLMFIFEDIVLLDDRALQRVLREIEAKDLTLALKVATEEVKNVLFRNMSDRAASLIREELEYMGPVRLKEVEAAQMTVVETIRALEEGGEIVITGRGGEEEIVA